MKPVINDVPAFDKNAGTSGTFITEDAISGYEVIIKELDSNKTVYNSEICTDSSYTFIIPPFEDDTLKNGCSYLLYIKIHADTSYISDPRIIKCITAPSFSLDITNLPTIRIDYTQNENEPLNEFYTEIRDCTDLKSIIFKSGTIYDVNEPIEAGGLQNGESYIISAYGKTLNGMQLYAEETFTTPQKQSKLDSVLTVANDKPNARVILNSHIDHILYKSDKSLNYNPLLDLSNNRVSYYDGFNLDGDFSMYIKYKPAAPKNTILSCNNDEIKLNFKTAGQYSLPITKQNFSTDGSSSYVTNDYNSITMSVQAKYGGIFINLPDDISGAYEFEKVKVTYKDGYGSFGYACRYSDSSSDEDITWGGLLSGSGTFEKTFSAGRKLTGFKFFNNTEGLSPESPASVTITSIVFTGSFSGLFDPYFELYTKNKMIIVDKDKDGKSFVNINADKYDFSHYSYDIMLSQTDNQINIRIKDGEK